MDPQPDGDRSVTVRFWASARTAAGTKQEQFPVDGPVTLAWVHQRVRAEHPGRLVAVLSVCSVLVGEQPVTTADPEEVVVPPGATVEYLPPFAGG